MTSSIAFIMIFLGILLGFAGGISFLFRRELVLSSPSLYVSWEDSILSFWPLLLTFVVLFVMSHAFTIDNKCTNQASGWSTLSHNLLYCIPYGCLTNCPPPEWLYYFSFSLRRGFQCFRFFDLTFFWRGCHAYILLEWFKKIIHMQNDHFFIIFFHFFNDNTKIPICQRLFVDFLCKYLMFVR